MTREAAPAVVADVGEYADQPASLAVDAGEADQPGSLARVRAAVAAATAALRAAPEVLWQACGAQLGELMGQVDQLAALAGGVRVAITAEAHQRGEIAASQCANTRAWVGAHAPSLRLSAGAGQVAHLVEATHGKPALAPVREAAVTGALPVGVAGVVLREFDILRRQVVPDAAELVLAGLIRIGAEDGAREVRRLRTALLARYGAPGQFDHAAERAAALVALSAPVDTGQGVWLYRFTADAEGKAILEAAIGVLSAPWHPDRARDPRTAVQRRGQALIEVCRRVTAAAKAAGIYGGHPETPGAAPSTTEPAPTRAEHEQVRGRSVGEGSDEASAAAPTLHRGDADDSGKQPRETADAAGTKAPGKASTRHDASGPEPAEGAPPPQDEHHEERREAQAGTHPPGDDPPGDLPPGDPCEGTGSWREPPGEPPNSDPDEFDPEEFDPERFDPVMMAAALAGMGAGGSKATLMLTMPLSDLIERIGAATVLGTTEDGTLLAPDTARRIACTAGLIPVVLGSQGEVLDLGRTERLFTPAQARAVLLRDRHCSFPRCDIPAFWTQLHHVQHWSDGGPTDIGNAALLCARHHTIVHRDRLTATITPTGVHWNTTPGSYEHTLTHNSRPAA